VTIADLAEYLPTLSSRPAWRIHYELTVGSTMDLARESARQGCPDRSLFIADHQLNGRGRQGRVWQAPPGSALLFTLLLRGAAPPLERTMLASVALAEAIEDQAGFAPTIKWPNDLLYGDAKLAGVLAESYSGPPSSYVLVGCGLNVNQDASDFASLGRAATSLLLATGRRQHRGELLASFLDRLDRWLALTPTARATALRAAWQQRLWRLDAPIHLREGGVEREVVVVGVDADGALLFRDADGSLSRTLTAEIVI
jgi:BirA family transcriptional regulator, biotin operon repressor / biotin---[acetyl-CoA-carboxylase] ligase